MKKGGFLEGTKLTGYSEQKPKKKGKLLKKAADTDKATADKNKELEKQKAELEAHNKVLFEEASKIAESLKGYSAVLIRQAAETGQLYGSVTILHIAAAVKEAGFGVERRQVFLEKPIKDLGVYEVKLNLHPEVNQTILVNVARTDDHAKKQPKAFNK